MYTYKSYDYVKYILSLNVDEGLSLYNQCINRNNQEIVKNDDDRLWQAFIRSEFDGTFEEWKQSKGVIQKETPGNNIMTKEDKTQKEKDIIDRMVNLRKTLDKEDQKQNYKNFVVVER